MIATNETFRLIYPNINYIRKDGMFLYLHRTKNSSSSAYIMFHNASDREEFINRIKE